MSKSQYLLTGHGTNVALSYLPPSSILTVPKAHNAVHDYESAPGSSQSPEMFHTLSSLLPSSPMPPSKLLRSFHRLLSFTKLLRIHFCSFPPSSHPHTLPTNSSPRYFLTRSSAPASAGALRQSPWAPLRATQRPHPRSRLPEPVLDAVEEVPTSRMSRWWFWLVWGCAISGCL